jgi:streptogramin lyase
MTSTMPISVGITSVGRRKRSLAVTAAVLLGLPLLSLSLSSGIAEASGVGQVTNYPIYDYSFRAPSGIAVGPTGTMWFTGAAEEYYYDGIGSITTSGGIGGPYPDPNPGSGETDEITPGPDGNMWFTAGGANGFIGSINASGQSNYVAAAQDPGAITTGPDGNLWFTTSNGDGGSIGQVTPSGMVTTFANTGIYFPYGITAGPDGNLWFTNYGNNTIGRISTGGVVTDFTGTGISDPEGITAGPYGYLWFTNAANDSIGRISTKGKVTNFTGTGISDPGAITTGPDGNLWFTNYGNNSIGEITPKGVVYNYTGIDIDEPEGIVAAPDGALWFTNYGNSSIGRITTNVTPEITSILPPSGAPGAKVIIKGKNLAGATSVTFNGVTATIISDTFARIVTEVPADATPGPINVTTPAGTAISPQSFT